MNLFIKIDHFCLFLGNFRIIRSMTEKNLDDKIDFLEILIETSIFLKGK